MKRSWSKKIRSSANLQRENVTLASNVKVLDEENTGLKTERQKLS